MAGNEERDDPGEDREDERTERDADDAEAAPRVPDEDPRAKEKGKRYMTGGVWDDPPLAVSVDEGEVMNDYAPGHLIAKVASRVTMLLEAFGGGFVPMFYGAAPTGSMTLLFGDPRPLDAQGMLPVEHVVAQAQRVAHLMDLEGDELYRRALEIGPPAERYAELAGLVQSEGISLRWEARGEKPRVLTVDRAHRHYDRLTRAVPKIDRPTTINGVLYRVIAEPRGDHLGTVGIRLHSWSPPPPGYKKGGKVIAAYEDPEIEIKIRAGLFDEPVEAKLLVRTPAPGTSFDPTRRELIVADIYSGPAEKDRLGFPLIDDDELEE